MKHLNLVTKLVQSGAKDTFFTKKYDRKKLKRFQTLAIKAARKAVREVDTKTQFDVQYDGKVLHAASVHGQTWCGADHPSNILHEVAH